MSRRSTRQFRGDWLRAARERTEPRVTNERLARACGVTLRTVQRWQDGETEPKGSQLLALSRALGVEPASLYENGAPSSEAPVSPADGCPRCGHAAGEHSYSRDDDYACQVDGCDCCFWLPAERDALAPLSAKDAA